MDRELINEIEQISNYRYSFIKHLGEGGYGTVFLVKDEKLGKLWAVKKIKDVSEKEIYGLKNINSNYFPGITDIIQSGDYVYLVLDYIEGKSLKNFCRNNPIKEKELIKWSIEIAKAINILHKQVPSILYLDCKPENIIITDSGELKMVDLGSIYIVEEKNKGRLSGTGWYAPPEQRFCQDVDKRSDIYAFGRTLYYLATGGKIIYKNKKGTLLVRKGNPNISKALELFIRDCCETDRENRIKDMDLAIKRLEKISRDNYLYNAGDNIVKAAILFIKVSMALITILSYIEYEKGIQEYGLVGGCFMVILIIICGLKEKTIVINTKEEVVLGTGKRFL